MQVQSWLEDPLEEGMKSPVFPVLRTYDVELGGVVGSWIARVGSLNDSSDVCIKIRLHPLKLQRYV